MRARARAFAPGRVNLIGEHTDYNEGLALPFAIRNGVTVEAAATGGSEIEAHAVDLRERDRFDAKHPQMVRGWQAFVRGTVGELRRAGLDVPGATLRISGNVPRGAGLSSSAALEVALALALLELAQGHVGDRIELAKLCSRTENEWVGAQTGLLDQLASLFGEAGRAIRIDFRSLELDTIELDLGEYVLVTLDSAEQHDLSTSGYNQRRAECAAACETLGILSLRDASLEMAAELREPLAARVRHVVSENRRVDAAVEALRGHDLVRLGELLDESHASLRDCYEVSTPAVEDTVARLKNAGALGARIVGGGFGGSVLGLLPRAAPIPDGAIEVAPSPGAWVAPQ